jgi:hypothetical protein
MEKDGLKNLVFGFNICTIIIELYFLQEFCKKRMYIHDG